jgi:hypothetical protein
MPRRPLPGRLASQRWWATAAMWMITVIGESVTTEHISREVVEKRD